MRENIGSQRSHRRSSVETNRARATRRSNLIAALHGFTGNRTERVRLFRAPARVNIIGEHTDYNGGFVLPMTTAIYTWLAASARNDRKVGVRSENLDTAASFDLDNPRPAARTEWIEYVRGVAGVLEQEDIRLEGASLLIDSEIPLGAGLSSSAALELVSAVALMTLAGRSLPPERIAKLCQRAEHQYAKVQCGIMDQYTIACAPKGSAILLDCRSEEATQIPVPADIEFVITDSGVRHCLPDGEYNSRRDECATAAALLADKMPGVSTLRDLDPKMLEEHADVLGDMLYRRCRHVVTENERVVQARTALDCGDAERLGALLDSAHRSLRDDFEVSCDEVETLVATANGCDGVLGSRMVGAGFGGCVLSATRGGEAQQAAARIRRRYGEILGSEPWVHVLQPTHPVQEVELQ